jgi:hypothetical protein
VPFLRVFGAPGCQLPAQTVEVSFAHAEAFDMPADFTSLHNYYERLVVDQVTDLAVNYPLLDEDQHPDVACVALNRLPPRYIRHQVDLAFHMTEKERQDSEQLIKDAVRYAFEFVQARYAMRARR